MVHEAVLMGESASLNSKAEWKGYRLARLTFELIDHVTKDSIDIDDAKEKRDKLEVLSDT